MIFWIFYGATIVISALLAGSLGEAYLIYCLAGMPAALGLTWAVSMLLGRPSQYNMVNFRDYLVRDNSPAAGWDVINTQETIYEDEISSVVYTDKYAKPRLRVYIYGLTGWRAHWLLPVWPIKREYILYLPRKDET